MIKLENMKQEIKLEREDAKNKLIKHSVVTGYDAEGLRTGKTLNGEKTVLA